MSERITMQDIADAVGVGKATVSRAFREDPKCGAALREKILKKAAEMGYQPDALHSLHMARLRGRQKLKMTGLVIAVLDFSPEGTWGMRRSVGGNKILKGAEEQAERLGLSIELIQPARKPMSTERLRKMLRARGIRGLIVAPMPKAGAELDFDFSGFSSVTIAHSLASPSLHRISHNQYESMWRAMEHLYQRGYRRFGLALGDDIEARILNRRQAAFLAYSQKHELHARLYSYAEEFYNPEKWKDAFPDFEDWLAHEKLEVVIGSSPWIPVALHDCGHRIPEDILYFNCAMLPNDSDENSAGIYPPWERIGAAAVDQIYGQMARFEYGVPTNPFEVDLAGEIRGL